MGKTAKNPVSENARNSLTGITLFAFPVPVHLIAASRQKILTFSSIVREPGQDLHLIG